MDLLSQADLRNANLFFVCFASTEVLSLLEPEVGAGRDELASLWLDAGAKMETDSSLSVSDRLYASYVLIQSAERSSSNSTDEAALPEEVVAHVRQRVDWANHQVTKKERTPGRVVGDGGIA